MRVRTAELLALAREGRLHETATERALQLAGCTPTAAQWPQQLQRLLAGLGGALALAGVVCVVAYNWQRIGPWGRFALAQAVLLGLWAAAWRSGLDRPLGKGLLTGAIGLIGPLLALFGQTYQTGADTYGLFSAWAWLALPWVLASRFSAAWLLWLGIVQVAVLFYLLAFDRLWALLLGVMPPWLGAALFNAAALLAWEWAARHAPWLRGRLGPRVIATLLLGLLGALTVALIFGVRQDTFELGALLWLLTLATGWWAYRHHRIELGMLALGWLSVVVVLMSALVRLLIEMRAEMFGFLLAAAALVAAGALGRRWFSRLARLAAEQGPWQAPGDVPPAAASARATADVPSPAPPRQGAAPASPWQALGERLQAEGLAGATPWPPRPEADLPWTLQIAPALGAWFAAIFLLSFIGGIVAVLWEVAPLRALLGAGLCAAAWAFTRPTAKAPAGPGPFKAQLGLAVSLAGLALLVSSFIELKLGWPAQCAIAGGLAALLWRLNPEPLHRGLMALLAVWAIAVAALGWRLEPGVTAVATLAVAVLWLRQARWAVQAQDRLLMPLALAAATALIALQLPDLVPPSGLARAGADLGWQISPAATVALRAGLLGLALAASGLWIAQRLQTQGTAVPGPRAAIVLGALLLSAVAWRMPGILAGLLLWILGTWAGRSALRAIGLVGLGVYLTAQYYHLQTTLMLKGLVLLASGAVLLATAALLHWWTRRRPGPMAPSSPQEPGPSTGAERPLAAGGRWPARALAAVGLALLLGGFNHSVWQKEKLLAEGAVVRLQLAPRDPRSLLTGDYMTLDYAVAREVQARLRGADENRPQDGYAIVRLDAQRVATLERVRPSPAPLAEGEVALLYRLREGQVQLGSNAFFFEEGRAERYEKARFGEYRVGPGGEMLLTRLLDEALQPLD